MTKKIKEGEKLIFKNGRAYFYQSIVISGIKHEGVYPLGNDVELIKKYIEGFSIKNFEYE